MGVNKFQDLGNDSVLYNLGLMISFGDLYFLSTFIRTVVSGSVAEM